MSKTAPFFLSVSGDDRDRTGNLMVANQALSQLSYVPVEFNSTGFVEGWEA